MADHITASVSGNSGPGVIRFEKGPNGRGLVVAGGQPAAAPITPIEPNIPAPEVPETPAPTAPATPFERLYPGVDPAKVEFFLDDTTHKLKYRDIPQEQAAEIPPVELPVEAPTPQPVAPAVPAVDEITQLRTQLDQQSQLMQAMLIAQAQGKPLAEVLGLAAQPEPDYSQFDLYDPDSRAAYHRQLKDELRAEMRAEMQKVQPTLEAAKVQQEYSSAELKYKADPNYQPRMIAALQLVAEMRQNGFPLSIEQAYGMASKLSPQAATPTQAAAKSAQPTTLTPEQAAAKAAQAARMPQNSGVRGGGEPPLPDYITNFKDAVRWTSQQVALGNIKA